MRTSELPLPADTAASVADENFITHAGWAAQRVEGMRVLVKGDLVLIDSGLPCDTFNYVCRARLEPETVVARVHGAIDYFRRGGRPFSWWVGPADQPGNLAQVLLDAGLERAETELAMIADLSNPRPPAANPPGFEIRRVGSPLELQYFANVNAANWAPPDPHVLRYYDLAQHALLSLDCPLHLYLGYVDGKPVATAELTVGGGVAGLYNVSTLAGYRRRGYGAALTLRVLFDARELGLRAAVLQAAAQGVGVYQRVGFRKFGDITEFKPLGCSFTNN